MDTLRWYNKIPIVNVFVDLFGKAAPVPSQLQELLQILALLSGLLLGVAMELPASVTFDEVQAALMRFGVKNNTEWSFCTQAQAVAGGQIRFQGYCIDIDPSNGYADGPTCTGVDCGDLSTILDFSNRCNGALGLLSISTLSTIVVYICMCAVSLKDSQGNLSVPMMEAWWKWTKYTVAIASISCIIGVWYFFMALSALSLIKLPSPYREHGNGHGFHQWGTYGDPYSTFNIWSYLVIILGAFVPFLAGGLSLTKSHRAYLVIKNNEKIWTDRVGPWDDEVTRLGHRGKFNDAGITLEMLKVLDDTTVDRALECVGILKVGERMRLLAARRIPSPAPPEQI